MSYLAKYREDKKSWTHGIFLGRFSLLFIYLLLKTDINLSENFIIGSIKEFSPNSAAGPDSIQTHY